VNLATSTLTLAARSCDTTCVAVILLANHNALQRMDTPKCSDILPNQALALFEGPPALSSLIGDK